MYIFFFAVENDDDNYLLEMVIVHLLLQLRDKIFVKNMRTLHTVSFHQNFLTYIIEIEVCLGSVAGSVIQATGRMDFEDGSRTATTLEVSNGLHSVRTSPEVSMAGPN